LHYCCNYFSSGSHENAIETSEQGITRTLFICRAKNWKHGMKCLLHDLTSKMSVKHTKNPANYEFSTLPYFRNYTYLVSTQSMKKAPHTKVRNVLWRSMLALFMAAKASSFGKLYPAGRYAAKWGYGEIKVHC